MVLSFAPIPMSHTHLSGRLQLVKPQMSAITITHPSVTSQAMYLPVAALDDGLGEHSPLVATSLSPKIATLEEAQDHRYWTLTCQAQRLS